MRTLVLVLVGATLWCGQLWAEAQNERAVRLYREGNYAEAKKAASNAVTHALKHHGPDAAKTATAINNLAAITTAVGRLRDAESLHRRALAIRETTLGPDDPHTASSLSNLGAVCAAQHKWTEAERVYKQALVVRERVFGPDHPIVAFSLDNVGAAYIGQRRFAEAEPLLARALAIRVSVAGPDHPDTNLTRKDLAFIRSHTQSGTPGGRGDRAVSELARVKPLSKWTTTPSRTGVKTDQMKATDGSTNRKIFLRHERERHPNAPAAQEGTALVVGIILTLVALTVLVGLMVGLSRHGLGAKRAVTHDEGRVKPTQGEAGTLATASPVCSVVLNRPTGANADTSKDSVSALPVPLARFTQKPSATTSSLGSKTTSRHTAAGKAENSESGLGVFFMLACLACCALAFGGCLYIVCARHPYDPNWRNNPKYDNYDYPLSPDNGGYNRVP